MATNRRLLELELEQLRRGQAQEPIVGTKQALDPVQTQEAIEQPKNETLGERLEREPLRERGHLWARSSGTGMGGRR